MGAVLPSVIAVSGTLLGSTVTHAFQRRTAERSARLNRDEKLRQERIDAYCGYAGALLEYRRVLVHRWFVRHEHRVEEDTRELQEEVYKLRYAAQEAMFRAQMLTGNAELSGLAERTLEVVTALHHAEDRGGLDAARDASRAAIRDFVVATTPYIG